jgi:toxin ParE1/3/4
MAHLLTSAAKSDLSDIWSYVAERSSSTEVANRLIDTITNRLLLLASQPDLGRSRNEEFGRQRRSFAVGEYVIVYRIQDLNVVILRIVHGKRDLESLFGH